MKMIGRLSKALALALALSSPISAQTGNGAGTQFELAFWQSVIGSDDPAIYEAYLEQYPTGTFSGLARAKLASLRKVAPPAAALASAPLAVPDISRANPVPPIVAVLHPAPRQDQNIDTASPVLAPQMTTVAAPSMSAALPRTPVQLMHSGTASETDDSALLEALAKSQELGGSTLLVSAKEGFSVPPRPELQKVPDLLLPSVFCSAEQRNAFHEAQYSPVMEIARLNNEAAVSHMQRLQQVYDSLQLARDPNPMNAVAEEARTYQKDVATPVYNQQLGMVQKFDAIMSVPIASCPMAVSK